MQKIAILGCGWLGLPLAKQLAKQYNVSGSVRKSEQLATLKIEKIEPFLIDLEADNLEVATGFFNAETLIITVPPPAENYVVLFEKLIKYIEVFAIKNVVYCSSISVYGNQTGILTEETVINPTTKNAIKIAQVEQLLLKNTRFKTSVLRLGGLIGAERHPAKYISGKVLKNARTNINLIHLTDAIGCIEAIIKNNLTGVFNVVTPYHPTKATYYTAVCEKLNIEHPIIEENEKMIVKKINSEKIKKYYTFVNYALSL